MVLPQSLGSSALVPLTFTGLGAGGNATTVTSFPTNVTSYDAVNDTVVPTPVIIVTPAGRRDRMLLLKRHLTLHHASGWFDEWHLWDNTRLAADATWINDVATNLSWAKVVEFPTSSCNASALKGTNRGITCFWRDEHVQRTLFTNTIVRFDDDIVWLDTPSAMRDWVTYTRANPQYIVTYANVLNNGLCTHLLQTQCNKLTNLPAQPR